MTAAARTPSPIDVYAGARIRTSRLAAGMSQARLAETLDLTFQQIQKYEKGRDRISVGRMVEIAHALGMSLEELLGAEMVRSRPHRKAAAPSLPSQGA